MDEYVLNATESCRKLTVEEQEKLSKDETLVSEFTRNKLEKEAKKNWDLFYKRNKTHFFKDRRWTKREFQELLGTDEVPSRDEKPKLLEIGAGVGNFIFPLIEESTKFYIYACDFSPVAVGLMKENPLYSEDKCTSFVADITSDTFYSCCQSVSAHSVDIVSLIFVLSAVHPDKMLGSLKNLYKVLRPGGMVIFRDYGLYDHAMLRFGSGHKLSENFYVRQDGTRAFYFANDFLASLFKEANFDVVTCHYVMKETVNRKENLSVPRVFVQGKFKKPIM